MLKTYRKKSSPFLKSMKPYSKAGEPVKMITADAMDRQRIERLKAWISFYRWNLCFFVEHYMGVSLYPYQRFWINLISRSTEFLGVASRASAKSWLIAVYCIARCILYPGTTVALASSTKAQAGLIISDKCVALHNSHPNIARETVSITTNQNKWEMVFKNGSKINVVVSGEGGRGHRSNVTVLEERRLIPSIIIDSIIRPFLVSRQTPYMKKAEYFSIEEFKEEPQEIIITSAHYKSAEWYPEAKKFIKMIANGDPDTKAIFLDYTISLLHGIKTKKQMIREKETLDPITFGMEYGNIPFSESNTSFYKMELFNRNIKRSWRPVTDEIFISEKKNQYDIPKLPDEYRIVGVDVAMKPGRTNDNTIIVCARLFPTRKGWQTEICYMESHNGRNTNIQALRIKQISEEFQANTLVLDVANAGTPLFDVLSSITKDEVRGKEYPAYTVMENNQGWIDEKLWEDLRDRTLGADAVPCVFPISATSTLNSTIAVSFKDRLRRKLISFLVDDNTEEEYLIKAGNRDILDQSDSGIRAYLLQAHLQTSLLINECISLETTFIGGLVKLTEGTGARKDRFSAVSYVNYFISKMDIELLKEAGNEMSDMDFLRLFQTT
jgi:hypothetical protein